MAERNPEARKQRTPRLRAVKASSASGAGGIDRLIHERTRLSIVSALAVHESLSFNELKGMLRVTDGNLSVHARKLEEGRIVACEKTFEGRVPKTRFKLTATGRRSLERYLAHMEALIRTVRER